MANIALTGLAAQSDWTELEITEQMLVKGGTVEAFNSLVKYLEIYAREGETTVIERTISTKTQVAVLNNSVEANGISMVVNFS